MVDSAANQSNKKSNKRVNRPVDESTEIELHTGTSVIASAVGLWLLIYLMFILPSLNNDWETEATQELKDELHLHIDSLRSAILAEESAISLVMSSHTDRPEDSSELIEDRILDSDEYFVTNSSISFASLSSDELQKIRQNYKEIANYREHLGDAIIKLNTVREQKHDKMVELPIIGKVQEIRIRSLFPVSTTIVLLLIMYFRSKLLSKSSKLKSPPFWAYPLPQARTYFDRRSWWFRNTFWMVIVSFACYLTIHFTFINPRELRLGLGSTFEVSVNLLATVVLIVTTFTMLCLTALEDIKEINEN